MQSIAKDTLDTQNLGIVVLTMQGFEHHNKETQKIF